MKKSEFNNALNVEERTLINSKNNIIILPTGKKIILKGINNYIIVEKENTLLIYPKSKDQEIGKL
jgi:mannose-1-phosphate guanylyltransferase